ncbi:putative transcription factor B3-Domain family [Helianthus anomalus]
MYSSFVKFLDDPGSLKVDVPLSLVKQVWGERWEHKNLQSFTKVEKWVVSLRRVNSMPIITDGWKRVAADLNLPKTSLLVFNPLGENCLELSFFVNGVCGDCYYTFHLYGRLGVTIIEDAFNKQCSGNSPPDSTYQICYKGSFWSPEVCNDIGIQDDDLLIFKRIDDVVFDLTVYRNETEIVLTKRTESDADVFKISKS